MKKLGFSGILFIIFLNGCVTYNHKNPYPNMEIFQYEDARAYVFENVSSDKLIINIEGSGWTSVLGSKGKNRWNYVGVGSQTIQMLGDKYTVFIPEKWDWNPETNYLYNFESRVNYTLDNLLKCYLESINAYLAEHNFSSVILVGISEGAALLPIIYENIKEKCNVTCMVSWGFGGLSLYEAYSILKDSAIVPDNYKQLIQYYCDMYEASNIEAYKTEAFPLTLMDLKPFDYYKNIDIPILFVHGEKDYNVPVESTRYIQENLAAKPFEYFYYKNMAHGPANYLQTIKLRKDILEWIKKME
jgi:esterase/lipase